MQIGLIKQVGRWAGWLGRAGGHANWLGQAGGPLMVKQVGCSWSSRWAYKLARSSRWAAHGQAGGPL